MNVEIGLTEIGVGVAAAADLAAAGVVDEDVGEAAPGDGEGGVLFVGAAEGTAEASGEAGGLPERVVGEVEAAEAAARLGEGDVGGEVACEGRPDVTEDRVGEGEEGRHW